MLLTGREAGASVAETPEWPMGEITEFSLLLPSTQARAVELAATRHGMTVGQFMRLMVKMHLEMARDDDPVALRA